MIHIDEWFTDLLRYPAARPKATADLIPAVAELVRVPTIRNQTTEVSRLPLRIAVMPISRRDLLLVAAYPAQSPGASQQGRGDRGLVFVGFAEALGGEPAQPSNTLPFLKQ
jgi:hypothetical protein